MSPFPSRKNRAFARLATALMLASSFVATPCLGRNCWDALLYISGSLGVRPKLSEKSVRYKSVAAAYDHLEDGMHGGHLIPLFLIGEQWLSHFQGGVNAFQGDPRRFVEIYGFKAARFFGFHLLSNVQSRIPDFAEFMGARAAVNAELVRQGLDPIALGFFPTKGETGPTKYLRMFLEDLLIPMAGADISQMPDLRLPNADTSQLHDLAYHSLAIFIPRDLLEQARRQTRILSEFIQYLESIVRGETPNTTGLAVQSIPDAIRVLMMQRLVDLDTLTANLATAVSIVSDKDDHEKLARSHEIIDEELDFHLYKGLGPGPFLKLFLARAPGRADSNLFKAWKVKRSFWFLRWTSRVSEREINELARGVGSAYDAFIEARGVQPEDSQTYFQTASGLCQQMQERRGLIARIATQLYNERVAGTE